MLVNKSCNLRKIFIGSYIKRDYYLWIFGKLMRKMFLVNHSFLGSKYRYYLIVTLKTNRYYKKFLYNLFFLNQLLILIILIFYLYTYFLDNISFFHNVSDYLSLTVV